jgi:hypothetical protein
MAGPHLTSLAEHPRAAGAIRRSKAYGGFAGYGIVLVAGVMHGAELAPALEHAVVGGIVAYLLTWAVAVAAWRRVLAGQAIAAIRRSRARSAEETTR